MTRSVHTHSLTGQKPSQGYPEDTIVHQKGVRTHSRIYPDKNGHSPRRWGLSIPGSFLRWRTNAREEFPIITLLLQKDCSKGVFSRGPIYNLFESELWSYSGMIQKLLWVKAPHWLWTLSVDWGVSPLLLLHPRGICDWGTMFRWAHDGWHLIRCVGDGLHGGVQP